MGHPLKTEHPILVSRISRRGFMTQAMALGVSTTAASSGFVAGCTSQLEPEPQHKTSSSRRAAGHFRAGLAGGAGSDLLDPATLDNSYIEFVSYGLRNNLVEISNTGEPIGELAESWEASPDAKRWIFKLRRGVEFHDGKVFDASDAVASLNHHRHEPSKSAAKPLLEEVVEIKVDDKNTLVIILRWGNADLPMILSDPHLNILPAKDGTVDWQSGIGTGAYILEGFKPGKRATMLQNPNYWKEDRGHFSSAEVLNINDTKERMAALISGEIGMMDRCDIRSLDRLQRDPDVRIEEVSGTLHYSMPMRTTVPPFNDNDVRLALKYSLDREALLQMLLLGHGTLGNDHPIGQPNRFHADELPQRAYDPDKAKFHLRKAGLSELTVPLHAADAAFGGAVDSAVLFRESASKAGITINVVREPNDGYWSDVWMQKPWSMAYWSGRPTEDWTFSTAYAAGARWNDTFWSHDRFMELLVAARTELDEEKRREMYVDMQRIVRDEGGTVIPLFANAVIGMNKNLSHNSLAGNSANDGGRGLERWWFS